PAFRARLAREFAAGTIAPPRRPRRGPWLVPPAVWVPLAAAAGLRLSAPWVHRAPGLGGVTRSGGGAGVGGGRAPPPGPAAELSARLRRGGRIRMPVGGTLDLVSPGQLAVSLAPGAEIVLPAAPNRLWKRKAEIQIAYGDAFFETGRAFHGASLDVHTHESTA